MSIGYMNFKYLFSIFLLFISAYSYSQVELRVATHNSFSIDQELINEFELQNQAQVKIIKLGDSGEMVNKLILTRNSPIADIVYGIDNINQKKAALANLFVPYQTNNKTRYQMINGLTAIDYGWITINYDRQFFQKNQISLPKSLSDLLKPQYSNLLVVEHPATSSPGLGFLLATYQYFGHQKVWKFWQQLKTNGFKVTKGWSEAYQKEFSKNGGKYPLVVSYFSSPVAEIFYSTEKISKSPTENLWLPGSYFFQIEGIGIIKNTKQLNLAKKFIDFMLSEKVQIDLQTKMWMLPANKEVVAVKEFGVNDQLPNFKIENIETFSAQQIQSIIQQWIQIMR